MTPRDPERAGGGRSAGSMSTTVSPRFSARRGPKWSVMRFLLLRPDAEVVDSALETVIRNEGSHAHELRNPRALALLALAAEYLANHPAREGS